MHEQVVCAFSFPPHNMHVQVFPFQVPEESLSESECPDGKTFMALNPSTHNTPRLI